MRSNHHPGGDGTGRSELLNGQGGGGAEEQGGEEAPSPGYQPGQLSKRRNAP